jgi:hypothetical protein
MSEVICWMRSFPNTSSCWLLASFRGTRADISEFRRPHRLELAPVEKVETHRDSSISNRLKSAADAADIESR